MNTHKILKYFLFTYGLIVMVFSSAYGQEKELTLSQAISLAVEKNRNLKISELEVSKAEQQSKLARSKALPSVNFSGQYAHYFTRPVFFGLGGTTSGTDDELAYARIGGENQFIGAVSIVQPLYDPALKPELQRARLQENSSRFMHFNTESEIIAQVKQTYLAVLVLNERLKLQHESLTRNRKVLEDARSLYLQGRALRVDTLRAYTTVKNLQPDILKLSNAIQISKLQLLNLLGFEQREEILLIDSLRLDSIDSVPIEEEIYEEAKRSRSDLQALSLNEKIATQGISLAKAANLPSVSLVGQYQLQTQLNRLQLGDANWPSVSFAGIQVSVPIFNGNGHTAKIKETKLAAQQSSLQMMEALEQLKVEVRQVVYTLHETAERLETQNTVRETALLSYKIIQYRYEKGVASRLELTDAELALTTAELNYLEAIYNYMSANIQLEKVLGKHKTE